MEFYIFEFCFKNIIPSKTLILQHELIKDFIYLLAKLPLESINNDKIYTIAVVPSSSARISLLRKLLTLPDKNNQSYVNQLLIEQLKSSINIFQYVDTPLSICYTSVIEEDYKDLKYHQLISYITKDNIQYILTNTNINEIDIF